MIYTFTTQPTGSDGEWHSACDQNPDAFGFGDNAEDAYEMARFALDSLTDSAS